jgi:hypothetical protein
MLQAIVIMQNTNLYIEGSNFTNISSTSGGLVTFIAAWQTQVTINNSIFDNTTTQGDGGILSTASTDILQKVLGNAP